jgi:hypothetical protein
MIYGFLIFDRCFQSVKALLQLFGSAAGVKREEKSEGGEQERRSDNCPAPGFVRGEFCAPHVVTVIIERIQEAFSLVARCVLLQFGEPLFIELVKNVIAHGNNSKCKIKNVKVRLQTTFN